jgi:hypothetical protein
MARDVRLWHICDIQRSRMDFRFRGKSGRAADITAMTELDPEPTWADRYPVFYFT